MPNIGYLYALLSFVAVAISVISAIKVYMNSPSRKLEAAIASLTASVEANKTELAGTIEANETKLHNGMKEHDRRIQRVEDEIKHLPTATHVAELQNSVTKLAGDIGRVDDKVSSMSHTVTRIDDYLREHSR